MCQSGILRFLKDTSAMGHGPQEHLEHAEHAEHASHDPFDRSVTVSIAVVAAILAGVTMAGHRAHNETLRLQGVALQVRGEALRIQTDASIKNTEASDQWAFYQAKKNRDALYRAFLELAAMMDVTKGQEGKKYWQSQVTAYKKELPEMKAEAEKLTKETKVLQEESRKVLKESTITDNEGHHVHKRADRFDFGELGLQLGVVLCSMAILTKSRYFWYTGLLCSLLGLIIALSGVFGWFMGEVGHH
jgi:hypothetical protein